MPLPQPPAQLIETDDRSRRLEDGIALCLSGGGYRAMLFHVGALWRHSVRACSNSDCASIVRRRAICFALGFTLHQPQKERGDGQFTE